MKKLLTLGIAAAMLTAVAAYAMPTIDGPTGGFLVPNSDIAKGLQVQMNQFTADPGAFQVPSTQILYGLTDSLEVGATYVEFTDDEALASLNAKYALPIFGDIAKTAVGAQVFAENDFFPSYDAYLAASKEFMGFDVTGNLAFNFGPDVDDFFQVSALAEKKFDNGAAAGVEYFLGSSEIPEFANLYAKLPISEDLAARIALFGIGQSTELNLSATMYFGGK